MGDKRRPNNECRGFAVVVLVFLYVALLPMIIVFSFWGVDNSNGDDTESFVGFESSQNLYQPLDSIEHQPLQIEQSMMNTDADPCEDPVDYWCGGWIKKSGIYRKSHPISFSLAQQHAVQAMSTIVAVELERSWDASPVARFHTGCTRTRVDPTSWGEDSVLFRQLLDDIRNKRWNGDTMAELFGRLMAVGADVPLAMIPMPNPTDTVNGGWVIEVLPDGMIDSGDFMTSDDARMFHVKNMMSQMVDGHRSRFQHVMTMSNADKDISSADRVSREVVEAMRLLAAEFVRDEKTSCRGARIGDDDDDLSYFQDRSCWEKDIWNASNIEDLGHQNFNWNTLFREIGAQRSSVSLLWLPAGRRWIRSVTNPQFLTEHQWRSYLEMSLRFAAGQSMAAEWRASGGTMGAISAIAHGGRHPRGGWTTDRFGTQKRRTRQKHWLLHLEKLHSGVQSWLQIPIATKATDTKNGVEMVSSQICTELTFVHLQPLFEHYYIEALGLDDASVRQQIGDLIGAGVDQFRRLINEETPSWTASTRAFFVKKLESLLIAVGSPPYQPLAGATFSRAIFDNSFPALADTANSLVQNMFLVRRQRVQQRWSLTSEPRLGVPTEDMPMYAINAYYDPSLNSVTLLAGILQAPFFSLNVVDTELLYSRILSIIGHELGHAVDPNGRLTDWSGSVLSAGYWNQASRSLDLTAFRETEECLIELYNDAVSANGNHDDGVLTLGENMADVIGLRVGYETLVRSSLSPVRQDSAKKFFGGWAQSWCARLTGAQELESLGDVHSLHEFRIAVPFSNMPQYSDAFKCKDGSKMKRQVSCDFFH
jgi:hypothetical protein